MNGLLLASLVIAVVLFFLACVLICAVAALAAWKASKLDAPLKSIAEALDHLWKPLLETVPILEDARDAVSEVKVLQDGTVKVLREVALNIRTLSMVVESFENTILPPEKRNPVLQPQTEADEIILERRLKEREAARGGVPQDLSEIGKHVGTA